MRRPGTFSLSSRISDPDMHHDTCVTHEPWCMPGSLTSGFLWSQLRGKRSQYSRRTCNAQFYVSGKRPIEEARQSTMWTDYITGCQERSPSHGCRATCFFISLDFSPTHFFIVSITDCVHDNHDWWLWLRFTGWDDDIINMIVVIIMTSAIIVQFLLFFHRYCCCYWYFSICHCHYFYQ